MVDIDEYGESMGEILQKFADEDISYELSTASKDIIDDVFDAYVKAMFHAFTVELLLTDGDCNDEEVFAAIMMTFANKLTNGDFEKAADKAFKETDEAIN